MSVPEHAETAAPAGPDAPDAHSATRPGPASSREADGPRRSAPARGQRLAPLALVTAATAVFATLLVLVWLKWAPLESADRSTADHINNLVAGHPVVVSLVRYVTMLGSTLVLSLVIAAAALLLALRRCWRLAAYLVVTMGGEMILDPALKNLVGRVRPVVPRAIAHAPGHSFPSGHSFGSMVCYGALFLVFAPAARGRGRRAFAIAAAALVAIVGVSRILLGVHYISDVAGGWALGITWLGLTAAAFRLSRSRPGPARPGALAQAPGSPEG